VDGCAFALFDTPIGRCAIVWRGGFIVGASLPEADDAALRLSILRRFPAAKEAEPPPVITAAIEAVRRLMDGAAEEFADLAIDISALPEFERRVLDETRAIPSGETRTYGEIARRIGAPGAARAVGRALGRNPVPIIIPCHRILAAAGKSGGFSAPGGASTKLRLLQLERARRGSEPQLFEHLPWQGKAG
jgi:methylated-DNA-[protein]-cysteine S-methyltransferase